MTCCRANSGPSKNESEKAGYYGAVARCDLPLRTVEKVLSYIASEIRPDVVIWLGDSIYAAAYNVSKESMTDVLQTLTGLMKKYFA